MSPAWNFKENYMDCVKYEVVQEFYDTVACSLKLVEVT